MKNIAASPYVGLFALMPLFLSGCNSKPTFRKVTRAPETAQVPVKPPAPIPAALDNYIKRDEPVYKWEEGRSGMEDVHELKLTSQQWQGKPWTHRVQIFRPEQPVVAGTAMIYIGYGSGSDLETLLGQTIANTTGTTYINVFNVPNQPLFDRNEDALIAYTFAKYLETGDETWPLLFPMTKSVVKAMDAVQEYSRQQWQQPINKFIVTGASKRGWTSYLVGAVDKRVSGIIPMVYDNLNLTKQMPHQVEVWGGYSAQIGDYTELNLQARMSTPQGRKLASMVDPWTYRERITMPKLLVMGTNDAYWPLDSASLYRQDLKGATNFLYAPNAGHMLNGQQARVAGAAAAWARLVAQGQPVAAVEVQSKPSENGGRSFTIKTGKPAESVRVWIAHSKTRDFRQAQWQPVETSSNEAGIYVATVAAPPDGMEYSAAFGDAEFPAQSLPLPLILSSPVVMWKRGETGTVASAALAPRQ